MPSTASTDAPKRGPQLADGLIIEPSRSCDRTARMRSRTPRAGMRWLPRACSGSRPGTPPRSLTVLACRPAGAFLIAVFALLAYAPEAEANRVSNPWT